MIHCDLEVTWTGHRPSGSLKHTGEKECGSLENRYFLTREARPTTVRRCYHAALPLQPERPKNRYRPEGPKVASD